MAANNNGKPPAITVRPETQEQYDAITRAAARKGMSRGEWLLAGGLQRLVGGPIRKSRKELAAASRGGAESSAAAKANVKPIPKGGR